MKLRKLSMALLFPLTLVACKSVPRPSLAEVNKHKEQVKATIKPTTKTKFTATITGRHTIVWDSDKAGPSLVEGILSADVDATDYGQGPSAMLLIPSIITKENFEDVYTLMDENFTPADLNGIYIDVNPDEGGGFTFSVYDVNVQMYVYGLQRKGMEPANPVLTKGRWNVLISYDETGVIAKERVYLTNSHTSDESGTADVTAVYQTE